MGHKQEKVINAVPASSNTLPRKKKKVNWISLNSVDSFNFLRNAKINVAPTNNAVPKEKPVSTPVVFSAPLCQPSTSGYKKPRLSIDPVPSTSGWKPAQPTPGWTPIPSTSGLMPPPSSSGFMPPPKQTMKQQPKPKNSKANKKDLFNGPKQDFNKEKLPKVSRLSSVMENVERKKAIDLCAKIRLLELSSKDVQGHVSNILSNIFHDNRCRMDGGLIMPEGEVPDFLQIIMEGLKTPKYDKKKITLEELVAQIELEEFEMDVDGESDGESDEDEPVDDEDLHKGDFIPFVKEEGYLDSPILDSIIPDISHEPWYRSYKKSHMRFHRLMNQPDIKMPKVKADDLIMTYNPKMARSSKPVDRTEAEQAKRDKNTFATRVTRIRAKYNEEQIEIQGAYYENCNIRLMRENAALIAYLNLLTNELGAQPRNWDQITEEMLAKEFMDEQMQLQMDEASNNDS